MAYARAFQRVWVGAWPEAQHFQGRILCVAAVWPADATPKAVWVPILGPGPGPDIVRQLTLAAEWIHANEMATRSTLVCDEHGIERAPLVAAWYLNRFYRVPLEQTYTTLGAQRAVIDRREWLPEGQR